MDKITFGRYLKWIRNSKSITQQELSDRINCALPTLSKIETGKEFPQVRIFKALERELGDMCIGYEDLRLDEIAELKKARRELLRAIKNGRIEEIERKIELFKQYMDEDDYEDKQCYRIAHLIGNRKSGLPIEDFLEEAISIFQMGREIPEFQDIPNIKLSLIEYHILYFIGNAYMKMCEYDCAELVFKGLLKNQIDSSNPFMRERYTEIAVVLAEIAIIKRDFMTANECLSYVFHSYIKKIDTRLFFHALILQEKFCELMGDSEGIKLMKDYSLCTQKLMTHMYAKYRSNRNIRSGLL